MNSVCGETAAVRRMESLDSPSTSSNTPETPRMDSAGEETSDFTRSPRSTTPSDSDDLSYDLAGLGFMTPPSSAPHPSSYVPDMGPPFPYEDFQEIPRGFPPGMIGMTPYQQPYMQLPHPQSELDLNLNYLLASGLIDPQITGLAYELAGFQPPSSPPPPHPHLIQNFHHPIQSFGVGCDPMNLFNPYQCGPGMYGGPPTSISPQYNNWIPPPMPPNGNNENDYGFGGCYSLPPLGTMSQGYHHPSLYMGMPLPGFQETFQFPSFAQGQLNPAQVQYPQFNRPPPHVFNNGNGMFNPYCPPQMGPLFSSQVLLPPSTPPAQTRSSRPLNPYSATFFPRALAALDMANPGGTQVGGFQSPSAQPQQQSLLGPIPLHYRLDPPIQAPGTTTPKVIAEDTVAAPYVSNVWDTLMLASIKPPPSNFVYYVPPRVDDDDYFGGQIHVWQDKMVATFAVYTPDVWTLQGLPEFNKYREGGWSYFTITCKLRFCCRKCMRPWTSMRGKVHFAFKFDIGAHNGSIFMKIFGQVCNRENCDDQGFQTPACYPEEIQRVLWKLSEYIGFIHYGLPLSSKFCSEPDKAIRIGNPRSPHRPALCQACQQGICSRMP